MSATKSKRVRVSLDAVLKCVPGNWCDSMLSGPESALPSATAGKWGCPDIERLLNRIRARIRCLPALGLTARDVPSASTTKGRNGK